MNTTETPKVETPKAEAPKVAARPAARKPVARKKTPAAKKVTVKKAAPARTPFDKLEGSVIAVPFKVANKTFLASLGLLSVIRKEVAAKVDAYAKDGEKVRDEIQASIEELRHDVVEQVNEARDRVRERFGKAA